MWNDSKLWKSVKVLLSVGLIFLSTVTQAQDSTRKVQTAEIRIEIAKPFPSSEFLPDVSGMTIASGRKTNLIRLDNRSADLSQNNARQVFSRIPGIMVWENDGSGIQMGVSTRGLSPNRSWEFNVRQDGADIAAEAFGYPEAYYSPPLEAVERIELVRGAASLSYGTQFGGALNYHIRKAKPGAALRFNSSQTLGDFGTFNSFQSVSGSAGKFFWTAWFHHRNANGWRENSQYFTRTGFTSFGWAFNENITLEANITSSNQLSQQAGGITDAELKSNAKISHRSRNWMSTPWNLASLTLNHKISENWRYEAKVFGVLAQRNSIGYVKAINIQDTIDLSTGAYNARQIDRDGYKNIGAEIRNLFEWRLAGKSQTLSAGIRAYSGKTNRNTAGGGNTESDYNLILSSDYGKSLDYSTGNLSVFAEQLLNFGKGFSITPGARLEYIRNSRGGYISKAAGGSLALENKNRLVPLFGLSSSYKYIQGNEFYGNISQAFRPVTFSELTPTASTETVDSKLEDSKGFNAELGARGEISFLIYDLNLFYLQYQNRVGTINNFRTNIGNSHSKGIEGMLELKPFKLLTESNPKNPDLSFYISGCYMNAQYSDWKDKTTGQDRSGKKLENAPELTVRSGLNFYWKGISLSGTWSYTSEVYTDALNTENATSNAQIGKLPAWQVLDLSASMGFLSHYQLKLGVNNVADVRYASRRSTGFPGPGLLPGVGRYLYAGFSVNF